MAMSMSRKSNLEGLPGAPRRLGVVVIAGILLLAPSVVAGPVAVAFFSGAALHAATVDLPAAKDNTLYESLDGSVSNGAGEYFFAGRTNGAALRRGVIAFDVASAICADSTVTSAALTLTLSLRPPGGPSQVVELRPLAADWGEGGSNASKNPGQGAPSQTEDATWIHRFYDTAFWTSAGGDFGLTASASQTVDALGEYTWGSTASMVSDVQGWLDSPGSSFGWLLLGDESNNGTARRFNTREHSVTTTRPVLTVTYDPPSCTAQDDVVLDGETVTGTVTVEACNSISATNYVVTGTGDATFRARSHIALGDGFEVETGGVFTAEIDSCLSAE